MWAPIITSILKYGRPILEAVIGNKAQATVLESDDRRALWDSYGKEWSYGAAKRTWFDVLMDGVNRVPRPFYATAVSWFFYLAFYDTERFARGVQALSVVPTPLWAILGAVITFYFGGRIVEKSMGITKEDRKALAEARAADDGNDDNPAISRWRRK